MTRSDLGPTDTHASTETQAPPRILLVDDEENILRSLKRLLRKEPYELIMTTSANEALHLLEQAPVSLIISDQRMPEMNGTDLLKQVHARWPDTIRIILSGYSEVQSILGAVNEGAIYKYLIKPWNDEELKLNVRRAVEQATLIQENKQLTAQIAAQNRRLRAMNLRLLQKTEDAMLGMSLTQDLMNIVSAGLINIGTDGLIVGVNDRACELLNTPFHALHGELAPQVLPKEINDVLRRHEGIQANEFCTEVRLNAKRTQICSKQFMIGKACRGRVLTIWEML